MLLQNITKANVFRFIHETRPTGEELDKEFCMRNYDSKEADPVPIPRHGNAMFGVLNKLKKQGKILFNPALKRWTPITPEE